MVTIVMKSGKVFRDVALKGATQSLVLVTISRAEVCEDELLEMASGGEVFNFQEWRESEWWVSFNTEAVEAVEGVK